MQRFHVKGRDSGAKSVRHLLLPLVVASHKPCEADSHSSVVGDSRSRVFAVILLDG